MQTKLTLRMEDSLIVAAKQWADDNGVSLSQAVASWFAMLPRKAQHDGLLDPDVAALIGIGGTPLTDAEVRDMMQERAAQKHQG